MKLPIQEASTSFPCACLLTGAECGKGLFPADKANSISLYFNSISLSRIADHSARKITIHISRLYVASRHVRSKFLVD